MVKIGWKMSFLDMKYWKWRKNAEIRLPRMRTKYFRFTVTKELRLENYVSYPCTNVGENRWKIAPDSLNERENFVTAEVGRRAWALNKSVMAGKWCI